MMLLDLLLDRNIRRGRLTVCALLLLCVTLISRAVTIGVCIYGLTIILYDGAVSTVKCQLVKDISIFGAVSLGRLLEGVVYSTVGVLMPMQMVGGLLGLLGVLCKHKVAIIVHVILQCLSMILLFIYFVLVGGVLIEFYSNVESEFQYEIQYGNGRDELQSTLQCCGMTGDSNTYSTGCEGNLYNQGCWDKWSNSMHTFCSTLMSFYAISFSLEVVNMIITDYKYRKLRIKENKKISEAPASKLPLDIIGDACGLINRFIERSGVLEFICRLLPVFIAGLGVAMISYGVASFVDYPTLSHATTGYIVVEDTGMNFFYLVKFVSGLVFTLGALALISAVVFMLALILGVNILSKVVFTSGWIALYIRARGSISDSLRELFTGRNYNDAWYNFVKSYNCCGIAGSMDTVDDGSSDLQLCRYEHDYADEMTCGGIIENHLDTFAKTTLSLLGLCIMFEILLCIYTQFKVRKLSSIEGSAVKGIPTYFKDFLSKLIQQSRLNWFPILFVFLVMVSVVTFIAVGISLSYDRIFTYVYTADLFTNITIEGITFSKTLDELTGTYISLAVTELVLYIMLIVTYTYKSKLFTILSVLPQSFMAVATLAFICRWIYVATKVTKCIPDELKSNLLQTYEWPDYINPSYSSVHDYAMYTMTLPFVSSWNILMYKLECCGASSAYDFNETEWRNKKQSFSYYNNYKSANIPSFCCTSDPSRRYAFEYDQTCQDVSIADNTLIYQKSCSSKVLDRFTSYYIPLFVLGILNTAMHIVLVVLLVKRYRQLDSKSKIDKAMNELWTSIKQNFLRVSFLTTNAIYGILGLSLVVYGAVNIAHYPTYVIKHTMAQIKFLDVSFDTLIVALGIGLIIIGVLCSCTALMSFVALYKSKIQVYFVYAASSVMSIFLKVMFIIAWIVIITAMKTYLASRLQHIYNGRNDLPFWNNTVTELNCCELHDPGNTDTCSGKITCTEAIQSQFNTLTGAATSLFSFMIIAEVIGLVLGNIHVRRLSVPNKEEESSESVGVKGIPTYLKNSLKAIWAESRLNVAILSVSGILFVFGFALILFGLEAMHDGYFTEKDVMLLLNRLSFFGRSFSLTMQCFGIGLICVGLIEIILSIKGAMSLIFTSKVLVTTVITLRGCFVLSIFTMLMVWISTQREVKDNLYEEMISDINVYYTTYGLFWKWSYFDYHGVNYWQQQTINDGTRSWNAMFTKFCCCGVYNATDFTSTPWYLNSRPRSYIEIPVDCCENSTDKYTNGYDENCQRYKNSYYTTGCSSAVTERLDMYSTALYAVISVFLAIQVVQLVLLVLRLIRLFRRKIPSYGDNQCLQCCRVFTEGLVIDDIRDELKKDLEPPKEKKSRRQSKVEPLIDSKENL